jgi:dihydroorotase
MVTSNPARMLRLEGQLGTLKPGVVADVSVLHDERGRWVLRDNENNQVSATRLLRPAFCLRAGQRIEADASILPTAEVA